MTRGFGWRAITATQWSVFAAITAGYGLYYVCRLSLSVMKTPLVAEGVLTEMQVGIVGSALLYVYALGKFVNGFLADRVNLRQLLSFGLLGSAAVNLILGWTSLFVLFVALWALNGWMQSMGAPSCVVSLTRWFEQRQRGTFYGLWSSSHNLGEGLTFILTAMVVSHWGWRAGFSTAGLAGMLGVAMIWVLYHDKSATLAPTPPTEKRMISLAQWQVLRSPVVWCIALASACMYVTRYAVNSWGIFFLQNAKGYELVDAGGLVAVSAVCGTAGTVASGWLSDVIFGGDRFKPTVIFGVLNLASLALLFWTPGGHWIVDFLAMAGFGLAIGALVCFLGGLMAVDLVSKQAAGAALGVVGVASYLGAGTQDVLSGWLIERGRTGAAGVANYDFTMAQWSWLAAALASILFTLCAVWFGRGRITPSESVVA